MSKTDIFRCRDAMVPATENVVHTILTPAESRGAPLPGNVKHPNDVRSARGGMPNPTGRRP